MILIHNLFERNWIIRLVGLCCVLQYPFGDGKRKHMQVRDQQRCEHTHTLRRGAEGRGKWLVGNEVYAWVGMRQYKPRSFAAGRWVLTATRSMHGNFGKCKTKWFLRGFLDQRRRGSTGRQPDSHMTFAHYCRVHMQPIQAALSPTWYASCPNPSQGELYALHRSSTEEDCLWQGRYATEVVASG